MGCLFEAMKGVIRLVHILGRTRKTRRSMHINLPKKIIVKKGNIEDIINLQLEEWLSMNYDHNNQSANGGCLGDWSKCVLIKDTKTSAWNLETMQHEIRTLHRSIEPSHWVLILEIMQHEIRTFSGGRGTRPGMSCQSPSSSSDTSYCHWRRLASFW